MPTSDWLASASFLVDPTLHRPAPRLVVGGTPTRVLRISPAGDVLLDELMATGRTDRLTPGGSSLLSRMIELGMIHPVPDVASWLAGPVTVIIPAHNHSAHVGEAVHAGSRMGPVVVVDDASSDATALEAESAGAKVIRLPTNVGPAAARNLGASLADTEIVVFIDADCVPESGCLEALVGQFADPEVGAVAPRVLAYGPHRGRLVARYEHARSPIDMGPWPGPVRPNSRLSFVPTATLAVRRRAFNDVGGFDEGLRFGEDVDFVWRLGNAGWTVRYENRVVSRHHHRRHPLDLARRRWLYGTSAGPLAKRHPSALAAVRASPWTLGAWAALLTGHPWLAAGLVGWSRRGLRNALKTVPGADELSGRLVWRGFLGASRPLASAVTRNWGPLAIGAAIWGPKLRPRLFALVALGKGMEWAERKPDLDPVRFGVLAVIDDLLFCGGVWEGCIRSRVISPLLPRTGRPRIGKA